MYTVPCINVQYLYNGYFSMGVSVAALRKLALDSRSWYHHEFNPMSQQQYERLPTTDEEHPYPPKPSLDAPVQTKSRLKVLLFTVVGVVLVGAVYYSWLRSAIPFETHSSSGATVSLTNSLTSTAQGAEETKKPVGGPIDEGNTTMKRLSVG